MNRILLKRFPSFPKPSYETVIHKKTFEQSHHEDCSKYDMCFAIPYGKRAFMWFTYYKKDPICCIIEIGRNQQLQDNIHLLKIPFPKHLALGTILSGYLVDENDVEKFPERKYFLADDIFMYSGYEFGNPFPIQWKYKWKYFSDLFRDIQDNNVYGSYSIHSIVMWTNKEIGFNQNIPDIWKDRIVYPVKNVQYRSSSHIIPHLNMNTSRNIWTFSPSIQCDGEDDCLRNNNVWKVCSNITVPFMVLDLKNKRYNGKQLFWVRAELAFDVYILYTQNNDVYQYAFVPDQYTSKMMNSIFRKIPENECLDKVEESDDEDVFENIEDTKYLRTKEPVLMECVFNRKFKKWIPLQQKPANLAKFIPSLNELVINQSQTSYSDHRPNNHRPNNHRPNNHRNPNNYRNPNNHRNPNHYTTRK